MHPRTGSFDLHHVPSHMADDDAKFARFASSVAPGAMFINAVADGLADSRAESCQICPDVCKRAFDLVARAESILLRNASLSIASASVPRTPDREVRAVKALPSARRAERRAAAAAASSHRFVSSSGGWRCQRCGKVVRHTMACVMAHLRSACPALPPPPAQESPADGDAGPAAGRGAGGGRRPGSVSLSESFFRLSDIDERLFASLAMADPPQRLQCQGFLGKMLDTSHVLRAKGSY